MILKISNKPIYYFSYHNIFLSKSSYWLTVGLATDHEINIATISLRINI